MTGWESLMIDPAHVELLRAAAITPEVAHAVGLYSIRTPEELPEALVSWATIFTSGIAFPWHKPNGEIVVQVRPDQAIEWKGEDHKYLWPRGAGAVLNEARPVTDDHDTVLIVEGTKQTLAAAGYAPANCAVYGVGGCRNWSNDGIPLSDFMLVEGKAVVVALDADAATNLEVYTAGLRIAKACLAEGATSVRFMRLGGVTGTNGLDDVLGKRPEDRRASWLTRQIADAEAKPAERTPKAKKAAGRIQVTNAATAERPMVYVDGDRLTVINQITSELLMRWNAVRLFNHGQVISQLTSSRRLEQSAPTMRPVSKSAFVDLVQETAVTVRRGKEDDVMYCYPEGLTIDAVMSRHDRFAELDRIARTPFVRKDGSICQAPGYDETSRTLLVLDESMADIRVPDEPTADDIHWAVKLITEEWLFDFFANMPTEADRTNTVALVLTPFVRGLVDVVPLAVVDGLQMGVGKNLLADVALAIPATGASLEPMPWSQDDEENRKVITSAFREGADVFVFDEAHKLQGAALARALTSAFWKDRQLGVSQMLGFPNQVTWVSLGNNVQVEGDITRRVYRIALRPQVANPQDRPASDFRLEQPRAWTERHRAEVVQAVLTLVRAWFAAGQPAAPKEVSFGSFERWERIVGGILYHAGFRDFLANTKQWRAETSFETTYWVAHVQWLLATFGSGKPFSCSQASDAMRRDPHSEPPPGMTDLSENPRDYNRKLGQAYARHNERFFAGVRLVRLEERLHDNKIAWTVVGGKGDEAPGGGEDPTPGPVTDSDQLTTEVAQFADRGGSGGNGGNPTPTHVQKKSVSSAPAGDTHIPARSEGSRVSPVTPVTPKSPVCPAQGDDLAAGGEQSAEIVTPEALKAAEEPWEGIEQPSLFAEPALPPVEYTAADLATWTSEGELDLPPGVLVFDIESTGPQVWPTRPDFIRITGVQMGKTIRVHADAAEVAQLLREATLIVGHNIMGFDLLAFAVHHGIDLHELAEQGRVVDTMLTEIVINPPEARTKVGQVMKANGLDALGEAKQLGAKTHDLAALAKEFGGYDQIPIDDERYVAYCAGDVNLTAKIGHTQERTPYARREHRVAALAAQIRMNGFRVDRELLTARVAAGEALRAQRLEELRDRYGLPLTLPSGKPAKAPHGTKAGKAAIEAAFTDLGVELARTKSGGPAFGKEAREALVEQYADRPDVQELLDTVGSLLGIRSVYGTVERCLVGDRVHPDITLFQASGRWSITEPGLTVMGKRGGKYVEREIFLPEPGHVIISADLSQVDARAVAAWCQDPAYLELFAPGRDSHTEIALAVWGDAGRRDDAKIIGHGWNYGMGLAKLAAKVGNDAAAREFDQTMRERFPRLVMWKRDVAEMADQGHILDNGFGRRLRTTPGYGWTQGPALMGQSAARDILMEGLLRMPRELYPYLRAVVHDEIVMSIPVERADEIEAQVMEALTFPWAPFEHYTPVGIEAGLAKRGQNWGACYAK